MDIILSQLVVKLARDRVCLADLLRLQTITLQHIVEVSIAPYIQLHRALEPDATFAEKACQHTMHNCRAYLAFNVVADHRQIGLLEAVLPVLFAGNEDW